MRDVRDEGDELALPEDALQQHVLGHVPRAAVRVVVEDDVALLEGVEAELLDRPVDGELDRADLGGAELGLGEHVARGVEDDAREVEGLVEDRRVRGRHHRDAHVAATARQVVVDDGQRDLVDHRSAHSSTPVSIRSAPCGLRSTTMPGSTYRVEPSSSITAGPCKPLTLLERRAMDDRGLDEAAAAHEDLAHRPWESAPLVGARQLQRRPPADRGDLEADELDHLALDRVAVALGVERVEAAERTLQRGLVQLAALDLDLVLVVLPEVAHVDRPPDLGLAGVALLPQLADGALGDPVELPVDERRVDVVRAKRLRPDLVDADVGEQEPERGEHPRVLGDDHLRHPEQTGDGRRVERPRAAEGEEREPARVVAPLERHHLDRARHVLVRDLDDRGGELERVEAHGLAERGRAPRSADRVELHPPGEEVLRVEPAEQEVRVGDRDLRAAAPVTDRAWLRPRRSSARRAGSHPHPPRRSSRRPPRPT